jgi:uncharacterized protein YbcI
VEAERPSPDSEYARTAAISRAVIQLTKSLTGRGPTQVKTYIESECVLVLMREAHTAAEGSMATGGRQRDVAQTRVDLSEDARQRFIDVIEQHTGRKVAGFISGSQQDPSLLAQVYVLDTSPLVSAAAEAELSSLEDRRSGFVEAGDTSAPPVPEFGPPPAGTS